MTKFSIVVPVYNVEKYIKKCLESIRKQSFNDFEVLCVDDCGNDGSMAIVEEFARKDERFKIIHHEHNRGLSAARNTAFDAAVGDFIVCVDSDDWLDLDALKKISKVINQYDVDCVWYKYCIFRENDNAYLQHEIVSMDHSGLYDVTPDKLMELPDYAWNKAYKRSKINELGMRFPEGLNFEDGEFFFKTFVNIRKIYYINEMLYNYRVRDNSIVTAAQKGKLRVADMFDIYMNIYNYLKEHGLLEEYKKTLLQLFGMRMKSILIPGQYEKVMPIADEVLKNINFPADFEFLRP